MLRVQSKLLWLSILAGAVLSRPGFAAPVPDLYVAQVPATALSGAPLEDAFARALDEVLVKVTGQRTLGNDRARRQAVGPAGPLVRQYQPGAGGQVRVSFDPGALRRRLDAANLPVWADDRPRTLVLLPDEPSQAPGGQPAGGVPPGPAKAPPASPPMSPAVAPMSTARQSLLATAAGRGIPVVFGPAGTGGRLAAEDPLLDPVATIQATVGAGGADVLLVGRQQPSAGPAAFRWTLVQGTERAEWQGDAAAGADGLADRLAARYAVAAARGSVLRVRIAGVQNFAAYGQLQSYLRSVDLIQSADLLRANGGALFFELTLRGDVTQLNDAFALQRVLEPVADFSSAEPAYRLVSSAVPSPPDVP